MKTDFSTVRHFCVFAGYPRSGHSLVGAIVDAHPNMILADEVHVQIQAAQGLNQQYIFEQLLAMRARQVARTTIESPWVGKYERLEVIGAKPTPPLAWGHPQVYTVTPDLSAVNALLEAIEVPTKFIHVMRNPYDNIAELFRSRWAESLQAAIGLYFDTFDRYMEVKRLVEPLWLDVRLEDIIAGPRAFIVSLCQFLEQEPVAEYVDACVAVIWGAPRIRRGGVEWSEQLIDYVADRISERELLGGYV